MVTLSYQNPGSPSLPPHPTPTPADWCISNRIPPLGPPKLQEKGYPGHSPWPHPKAKLLQGHLGSSSPRVPNSFSQIRKRGQERGREGEKGREGAGREAEGRKKEEGRKEEERKEGGASWSLTADWFPIPTWNVQFCCICHEFLLSLQGPAPTWPSLKHGPFLFQVLRVKSQRSG